MITSSEKVVDQSFDKEIRRVAEELLDLTTNYTSANAAERFRRAESLLTEPALSVFRNQWLDIGLKQIREKQISRTTKIQSDKTISTQLISSSKESGAIIFLTDARITFSTNSATERTSEQSIIYMFYVQRQTDDGEKTLKVYQAHSSSEFDKANFGFGQEYISKLEQNDTRALVSSLAQDHKKEVEKITIILEKFADTFEKLARKVDVLSEAVQKIEQKIDKLPISP